MAVFAHWPTTAFVLDAHDGAVIAANPAALRSIGCTFEEMLRAKFSEIFTADGVAPDALPARVAQATSR